MLNLCLYTMLGMILSSLDAIIALGRVSIEYDFVKPVSSMSVCGCVVHVLPVPPVQSMMID